jgi:hypothetical protein
MKATSRAPATTSAALAPLSVEEHFALGKTIREIHSSYLNRIPEERFKQRISRVATQVFEAVISAAQLRRAACEPSLIKITSDVLSAKGQDASGALARLSTSAMGQEALWRVVQAVSLSALQNHTKLQLPPAPSLHPDQSPQPLPTLSEVHASASMFAAQPLEAELNREEAYRARR